MVLGGPCPAMPRTMSSSQDKLSFHGTIQRVTVWGPWLAKGERVGWGEGAVPADWGTLSKTVRSTKAWEGDKHLC